MRGENENQNNRKQKQKKIIILFSLALALVCKRPIDKLGMLFLHLTIDYCMRHGNDACTLLGSLNHFLHHNKLNRFRLFSSVLTEYLAQAALLDQEVNAKQYLLLLMMMMMMMIIMIELLVYSDILLMKLQLKDLIFSCKRTDR